MNALVRITGYTIIGGAMALACGSDDNGGGGASPTDAGSGTANGSNGNGDGNGANGNGANGNGANGNGANGNGSSNGNAASNGSNGAPMCDMTPCEGREAFGMMLSTCCMSADQCGIDVVGNCLDVSQVDDFISDGGFSLPGDGGFSLGEDEVIVSDPACEDVTFDAQGMTTTLSGCCDQTGVCGASTEDLDFGGIGLELPVMCVTADEFGGSFGEDAGAPVPCNYPSDGGTVDDAGNGNGNANGDAGHTSDAGPSDAGASDAG